MSNCAACGHSVVAWCPETSKRDDDVVCYNCGLHADSEAAKRIRKLESALFDIVTYCKDGYGDHEADEVVNATKLLEQPR